MINQTTSLLEAPSSAPATSPCPAGPFTIGAMIKHFTYDGLGRLVRVQSPWPDSANASGGVRSERFYYDGARRIQELVTDPLATVELLETPEGGANNPELGELLNQTIPGGTTGLDGSANPLNFESGQLENPGPVIGAGGTPLPTSLTGLEREYIWGPGDNGLDEILVQYDSERKPFWMIQDGGGDVVAMCDLQGGGGSGGTARVVKSWQYDAYGQCLRATDVVASSSSYSIPINRVGHKCLFMDRLDVGLANGNLADNPRLAPFSTVLYQNRNRTYSPRLGRFVQRDPNESGQSNADIACLGELSESVTGPFEIERHLFGGNTHEYAGSGPWQRQDPSGLFFTLGDVMAAAGGAASIAGDYNHEVLDTGRSISNWIGGGLLTTAMNQAMDINWALNWDETDDAYNQSGISEAAYWARNTTEEAPASQYAVASGAVPRKISRLVNNMSDQATGMGIYIVKEKPPGTKIIYVGRSKNLSARMAAQRARFGPKYDVVGFPVQKNPGKSTNLAFSTRGLEDVLIRFYQRLDGLENVIRGVARANRKRGQYYEQMRLLLSQFE